MSVDPRVSVAIPLYDEEEVLDELLRRVRAVLDGLPGGPHEIVIVDDGSADGTLAKLRQAVDDDPRVVAISLSRNFGHQAAISAALDHVAGDVVVVMDGDLQDPPETIPRFLEAHAEGYDVVYATRSMRRENVLLRLCYFLFYRLIALLSDTRLPLDSGDFALLSRRVVDEMVKAPERHRYLRGLRTWVGFRQKAMPVEREARAAGRSKYSTWKLLKLAFDGIFAFTLVPLRAASLMGFVAILGSALYGAWALYAKLVLHQSPKGFSALILAIIFFGGVQLVFLGIIGEYVGRIYDEVKRRPQYVIGEIKRGGPE